MRASPELCLDFEGSSSASVSRHRGFSPYCLPCSKGCYPVRVALFSFRVTLEDLEVTLGWSRLQRQNGCSITKSCSIPAAPLGTRGLFHSSPSSAPTSCQHPLPTGYPLPCPLIPSGITPLLQNLCQSQGFSSHGCRENTQSSIPDIPGHSIPGALGQVPGPSAAQGWEEKGK